MQYHLRQVVGVSKSSEYETAIKQLLSVQVLLLEHQSRKYTRNQWLLVPGPCTDDFPAVKENDLTHDLASTRPLMMKNI